MGWMDKAAEVYDVMLDVSAQDEDELLKLIPIGFIEKPVKYLVTIHADGTFSSASEIAEKCVIPSTPQAEARTGNNGTPFPLVEQLKYLAYDGEDNLRLDSYLKQLKEWCEQPDAPGSIKILYQYLKEKTLLQDMRDIAALQIKYNEDDNKKDAKGKDAKEFVQFAVESSGAQTRLCDRQDVKESWSRYFAQKNAVGNVKLCYVTGERRIPLENHPKIQGNAKLISAKDAGYPMQYKGRFVEDRSAATVSAEISLKAHNALKWLLEKQGFRKFGMNIVAWNVQRGILHVPVQEPDDEDEPEEPDIPDTFEEYADALRNAAKGKGTRLRNFQKEIGLDSEKQERVADTVILGMEAATDGRMSINYYQQMEGNTYAEHLMHWYETCCWEFWYEGSFGIMTPTPLMIAKAVMGTESVQRAQNDKKCEKSDAKLMRDLYKRLLHCMVEKSIFPKNLLNSAIRRAEFPLSFKNKDSWSRLQWDQSVRTTCALIRKSRIDDAEREKNKEIWIPEPNVQMYRDRNYLYGRLFAVADKLECDAAAQDEKKLPTNAIRQMQRFVQRPAETWKQLHLKLIPYLKKLGTEYQAGYYQWLIGEIEALFVPEQRADNSPLNEDFLIGMYAQNRELFTKAQDRVKQDEIFHYMPESDRSELFGCLLAVADCVERQASKKQRGEQTIYERDGRTNALLRMQVFASRPAETWIQIHEAMIPYLQKMGISAEWFYSSQLYRLESMFDDAERLSNEPLDSSFLHGYYCMRKRILTGANEPKLTSTQQERIINSREQAFGALLALENRMERAVLDMESSENENRFSNAIRLMHVFPMKPESTWKYLEQKMLPYERKLRSKRFGWAQSFRTRIDEIKQLIEQNHWDTDEPLKIGWLHFYYINHIEKKEKNNGCIRPQD